MGNTAGDRAGTESGIETCGHYVRPSAEATLTRASPQLLSTLKEKESYIESLGVEQLVVLPFTRELAALSAEAFMRKVLHDQLSVKVLLTGYDNRFGHDRTEGFDDYVGYGKRVDGFYGGQFYRYTSPIV